MRCNAMHSSLAQSAAPFAQVLPVERGAQPEHVAPYLAGRSDQILQTKGVKLGWAEK